MKKRAITLILLIFILSIGFAAAAETNQTDTISLDDTQETLEAEISVEGDSFTDIQDAINTANTDDTIYLNGKIYTGKGSQITVSKSLTIDGASKESHSKSILDANDSSRIFYVNGTYDVTFKNIIFMIPKVNGNGRAIYHNGGNLTVTDCEFTNLNYSVTGQVQGGIIRLGDNSNAILDNVKVYNNRFQSSGFMDGFFMMVGQKSKIKMHDIDFHNNFMNSNGPMRHSTIGALLLAGKFSDIEAENIMAYNNTWYHQTHVLGGLIYVYENSKINVRNLIFNDNNITTTRSQIIGGFIYMNSNSNSTFSNLSFYNLNLNAGTDLIGGMFYFNTYCKIEMEDIVATQYNLKDGLYLSGGLIRTDGNCNLTIRNLNYTDCYLNSTDDIMGGLCYTYQEGTFSNYTNVVFSNNYVYTPNLVIGSAIYCYQNSYMDADGFTAFNNTLSAYRHRGIIYSNNRDARFNITHLNITNNRLFNKMLTVDDPFMSGGYINQGLIIVIGEGGVYDSVFANNYCNSSLGVALQVIPYNHDKLSIVDNCQFFNNSCLAASKDSNRTYFKDHGGAICVSGSYNGSAIIRNCLFVDNLNSQGGAITPHNHCIVENCRFINNTATKFYGGAISTEDEIDRSNANITIRNCYFEGNGAPIGGAIQAKGDLVEILNCTFKDNRAVQGGAVFLEGQNLTIINCSFTDNNATDNLDSRIMTGQTYLPQAGEWNTYGGAVYIHGFNSYLENNKFLYNSAIRPLNQALEDKGGAVYISGDNATLIKCYFDDNFAHSGNGSAIYIMGVNATVDDSEFYNHDSGRGTVFIRGSHASILNSIFKNNTASLGGAGIYSIGNNSLVDDCTFENNNATVHGGAIHSYGNYIRVLNSRFISNNAHPIDEEMDNGLGGAIYTKGDFNDIAYCVFSFNTARNGSAIYNRGANLTIEDCNFHYNQAYSYRLNIQVEPEISNYTPNNKIQINITHIGGDNIINAIYNDGSYKNIFFYNVTYEHSSTSGGKRNSGLKKVNPVESAEKSNNGELIYQDSREDLQIIDVIVAREKDTGLLAATQISGDVIQQFNGRTGLYGNISFALTGDLKPGKYNVYASHPDDRLYKGIENITSFEISPQVDLTITKDSDRDSYFVGDIATYTITLKSLGTDARNVNIREILPNSFEIIDYTASKGEFIDNIWQIPLVSENSTETLTIKVKLTANGTFTNIVNVTSQEEDINTTNNIANATVTVKNYADLDVSKSANVKSVKVGDTVIWTITVKNNGIINATGVKVTDKLPSDLKYISHTQSKGEFNPQEGVWDVGELAVNETVTLEITTQALKAGKTTNEVSVSSNEDDNDTSNNHANSTVEIEDVPEDSPVDDDLNEDDPNDDSSDDDSNDDIVSKKKDSGKSSSKVDNHTAGNPILLVLLALISICITARRKL